MGGADGKSPDQVQLKRSLAAGLAARSIVNIEMIKVRFVRNSVIRNYRDSNRVNGMIQMGRRNCPCLINIG